MKIYPLTVLVLTEKSITKISEKTLQYFEIK